MNEGSAQRVKMWIYANACKHGLDPILKILADDQSVDFRLQSLVEDTSENSVDSQFMFLLLLKKLLEMLQTLKTCYSQMKCWNKELLSLSIELLCSSYEQQQYITFSRFTHLITRLRIIQTFGLFLENRGSAEITHHVKAAFPLCTAAYLNDIKQQYKVKEENFLVNFKNAHSECRKFFFKLAAVNEASRKEYFEKSFKKDFRKRINETISCLKPALSILKKKIPPSMIEKILQGVYANDPEYANDPMIQLIPEYIVSADDIDQSINLLQVLDSNPQLLLTEGLGPMSALSDVETESQAGFSSDADDDDDIEIVAEFSGSQRVQDPVDIVVDSEAGNESEVSTPAHSPELPNIQKFLRPELTTTTSPHVVKLRSPRRPNNDRSLLIAEAE